ncbi:MAG: TIGR01459 family HAD-type hydrolase [Pseudomonadota bacterium]
MTQLIETLDAVAGDYDALLVDLWGCYHNGIAPYAQAMDALRRYRAEGGIVVLLTNAPRPASGVLRFLDRIGAPAAPGDTHDGVMSSGEACRRAMADGRFGRYFHYIGPDRDLDMLADFDGKPVSLDEAETILLVGLRDDQTEQPSDYDAEFEDWAARGLPVLCANPDIIVDRGHERLWCAGALAQRYAELHGPNGAELVWYGKPHPPSYTESFAMIDALAGRAVPRSRILGIGDGIATDVKGAHAQGCDAIFVTGGIAAREVGDDQEHPDPARLDAFCATHGEVPRYAMPFLR